MTIPRHLTLHIVTPDRALTHEQVDEVVIPGTLGDFGVLPGHTPFLSTLRVGQLWYRRGQDRTHLSVAFGFAEVVPDRVTILAHLAERAEEIDVARAETARRRAQALLARPPVDMDFERARIALMKSFIRLQVASKARTRS